MLEDTNLRSTTSVEMGGDVFSNFEELLGMIDRVLQKLIPAPPLWVNLAF